LYKYLAPTAITEKTINKNTIISQKSIKYKAIGRIYRKLQSTTPR